MKKIILLLAMGVALTTQTLFAQVPSYVPTNGLVGYWPFNGNANDISGNGNNGTNYGATLTADRFGNVNSSYNFNGIDNYIRVLYSFNNIDSIDSSISGWVNINNNAGGSFVQIGIDNINLGTKGYSIGYGGGDFMTNGTNLIGLVSGVSWYQSSQSLILNSWHHFVIIKQSNNFKFYLNGILVYSNAIANINSPTADVFFGSTAPNDNNFFGKLDDIGIWNRALTQEEITNLYNANQCITNITVTDTLIINVGQLSFNDPVIWANNITIAPNPASTQININFNNITNLNGGTLKVINSLGQQVATTPITTSGTNSTMQLATWGGTGMYFVQIINPQGQIVDIKKIILQ